MKKIILIVIVILVVVGAGLGVLYYKMTGAGADITNPPQFIQADFIDLSKIYSISKFRSGEGHDFSGGGETCRSMKHYYTPQFDPSDKNSQKDANGIPPKPNGIDDIAIYSPVDGKIVSVSEEHTPIGKQVTIVPDSAKAWSVRLFHIYLKDGYETGTRVKAGEQIAVIGGHQGTDIAVQPGRVGDKFVSYFSVMPDSVFASYIARGAASRDDFIITKEYRDAHPIPCQSKSAEQQFIYPADYDHMADDVHLSGYVDPTVDRAAQEEQRRQEEMKANTPSSTY